VIAADLSVGMVGAARTAVGAAPASPAAPVAFAAMDAQQLAVRDEAVDAVMCLLGLMFFADPAAGLAEFRRVLRPGGRAALAVWAEPERAPFPGLAVEVLARHLPMWKRDLEMAFSLADEAGLETLLRDSGFEDVAVARESRAIKFESFDDFWEPVETGSRAGAALRDLPEAARRAVRDDMRARLAPYETQGWLVMDCETLLASGRR
jgi:SAM-dependent methyltransferase